MATSFAVPITLLALLGSVACQSGGYAPSPSPPAVPPSPSPSSPNMISYPPNQSPPSSNPPTYPPSPSCPTNPQPSPSPVAYPPSQSQLSSTPTAYTPNPSPPTYPPSPSLLDSTPPAYPLNPSPPTYPPSPSPLSPILITYPPNASPSPTTYPPSPSPTPATYPPSANPLMYTSPSPSPTNYAPSMSPGPISPSHPPSASPPSPSPSSSTPSPSTYPTPSPSPIPYNSISSPPNYPPSSASPSPSPAPSGLSVGYYRYSCPNAESIVREAVKSATDSNPGTGAGLIRLFFHDCFVEGCDASVLLNTTGSSEPTERASAPNLSLRGFEVIDAAKAALEAACPGVVSCADIVAFAGRDATYFLSGNAVDFDMPAGRYDGRVSLDSEALANLPPPFASLQDLKDMFAAKGLDTEDMVTLSGAHTVGRSHCSSFSDRLPPNTSDMNATLASPLSVKCSNGTDDSTAPQDSLNPDKLDSQYYRNVINHEVLFASDAALLASNQTADMVLANAFMPGLWEAKFKAAMVKMGRAGVKTSIDGEIRKKCWMVN